MKRLRHRIHAIEKVLEGGKSWRRHFHGLRLLRENIVGPFLALLTPIAVVRGKIEYSSLKMIFERYIGIGGGRRKFVIAWENL